MSETSHTSVLRPCFVELTSSKTGTRFLYDFHSGWEIYDEGADKPAMWSNYREARNLNVRETYAELRARFLSDENDLSGEQR